MTAAYHDGAAIKGFTQLINDVDYPLAEHVNEAYDEIEAIETVLGTAPQGSAADLKTRLAVAINNDGTLKAQAASLITSGAFADAQIPSLAASKITSGNLAIARMPTGGNWGLSTDLVLDRAIFAAGYSAAAAFVSAHGNGNTYSLAQTGHGFALKNAAGTAKTFIASAQGDHLNFGTGESVRLRFIANNSLAGVLSAAGRWYIGPTEVDATALLHLAAGTATAGTAPVKLTTGVKLTTPEDGALEYDGTDLLFTVGATRKKVTLATYP